MKRRKKKAYISRECVACGSCIKNCPFQAISVYKGLYTVIEEEKCIGCGKCERICPASVISLIQGGVSGSEEADDNERECPKDSRTAENIGQ